MGVDVLILCAVPVEWAALKSLVSNPSSGSVHSDPSISGDLWVGDRKLKIALVETGMGTTQASLVTGAACQTFSPAFVIYAGVAGGVKDVAVGDVAIASKVHYYEGGKTVDGDFRPRPDSYPTPHGILTIAREIAHIDHGDFRVLVGAVASGEKVLADVKSEQVALIKNSYGDSLVVEMEGHGFMTACARGGIGSYLVVRAVSDLIDDKTKSDQAGGQEKASENLTRIVYELIERFCDHNPIGTVIVGGSSKNDKSQIINLPQPNSNETYALLAPKNSEISEVIIRSGLPLTLVLDLDSESDRTGLLSRNHSALAETRPVHLLTASDPLVASNKSISWVAVRGLDRAETLSDWKRNGRRQFRRLLADFARETGVRHTNVIIAADYKLDEDWLEPLVDDLLSEFGSAVTITAIGHRALTVEADLQIDLSIADLAQQLSELVDREKSPNELCLPRKDSLDHHVVPAEKAAWLEEDMEIVSADLSFDDQEPESLDFLRGGTATWAALDNLADVLRTVYLPWKKSLDGVLKNRRTLRQNLFHEPGAGGTTLARRLAFDLRAKYPTVILSRYRSQETSRRLVHIARTVELPILVIVDTASVTDADANELMEELNASSTPALVLYVARRYKPLPVGSKATFLFGMLDDAEADGFFDALVRRAPWNDGQLLELRDSKDQRRNAFFFGLSAFEDDFRGVDAYVASRLEHATEAQTAVIKYCALAHLYGQMEMPEYSLASLIGLPEEKASSFSRVLDPGVRQLLWRSPNGGWRTTHPLVAKYVLMHLGGGEFWKQMLTKWGRELGDFCLDRSPRNQDLEKIVKAIFIEREGLQGSGNEARASFAKILEDIPAPSGAGSLIAHLSNLLTDDPHFAAHAARFHAFILRDFETASQFAERARKLEPEDHILQHVVGMVNRAKVQDAIGLRDPLDEIARWANAAAAAFESSRKCAPTSNQHPYISEIQMRIALVDYGTRGAGSISEYLAKEPHPLVVESISIAEDLLARVRYLGDARNPTGYEERSRGELTRLYGDYERALQLFESLLDKKSVDPLPVRRQIVWTQLARVQRDWKSLSGKSCDRIISLLEQNMFEGSYGSADVRQWWRAIRYVAMPPSQNRVHEVLTYWRESDPGAEAVYASYVAHAIDLLDGIQIGRADYEKFKNECSARTRQDGKRLWCLDWIGEGEGLGRLVHQSELGPWDQHEEFWSDRSRLKRLEGRIASIKGPQAGTVNCDGIEAFFVPSRAGAEKGRDENRLVSGYLAFSHDGPRFWDPNFIDSTESK